MRSLGEGRGLRESDQTPRLPESGGELTTAVKRRGAPLPSVRGAGGGQRCLVYRYWGRSAPIAVLAVAIVSSIRLTSSFDSPSSLAAFGLRLAIAEGFRSWPR